jgi:hypothetical protein
MITNLHVCEQLLKSYEKGLKDALKSVEFHTKRIEEIKKQMVCEHPDDKITVTHGIHSYDRCTLCGYEIMD